MKKIFALLTAPMLLAGLLFSCKPEQSELNLESLPGTATVTGKVEYNPGVTKVGEALVKNYKLPAAGRTVCVKVYTESYLNPNEEPSGSYRTFTAKTDDKGHYSISVPVGYSPIRAEVVALPFIGDKTDLDANNQIITLNNAVFAAESKYRYLEDQTIENVDFLMASDKEADVEYNQKVTVKGLVEAARESRSDDAAPSKVYNAFPCDLLVQVYINGDPAMTYNVTANANGNYTVEMTLPNNCWNQNVRVYVVKEATMDEFTHYYYQDAKWNSQVLNVTYAGQISMELTNSHKVAPMNMPTLEITPQPVNLNEVKGIGNAIDNENGIEYHNPMGWGL